MYLESKSAEFPSVQRIPPELSEYKNYRAAERKRTQHENEPWGKKELGYVDQYVSAQVSPEAQDVKERFLTQEINNQFGSDSMIHFVLVRDFESNDELLIEARLNFFREAFTDLSVASRLEEAGVTNRDLRSSVLIDKLKNGSINADLLMDITRVHTAEFERKKELLKEEIPRHLNDFSQKVFEGIDAGWLPLEKEFVVERLKSLQIEVFDPMKTLSQGDHTEGLLRVSAAMVDKNELFLKHVVFHEAMHALSGTSVITYKEKDGKQIFAEQKVGLRLLAIGPNFEKPMPFKKDSQKKTQDIYFTWLNEAVTERLTLKLLGDNIPEEFEEITEDYQIERFKLEQLIRAGVSEELILRAYFENYGLADAEDRSKRGLPAWRQLSVKLTEVGGKLTKNGLKMSDFARLDKR